MPDLEDAAFGTIYVDRTEELQTANPEIDFSVDFPTIDVGVEVDESLWEEYYA